MTIVEGENLKADMTLRQALDAFATKWKDCPSEWVHAQSIGVLAGAIDDIVKRLEDVESLARQVRNGYRWGNETEE